MGFDLRDKVVLITGASGGIGRACAKEFTRAGCFVVAAARSSQRLESLCRELGSDRVAAVVLDVTDRQQREDGVQAAMDRFGRIDVLVNNAGWATFASVARTPPGAVLRMMETNFLAPIALIQLVLPGMLERRLGQIINISSVVGNQAIPRMGIYGATKAALSSLSTALRMELKGTGIDVILVSPGSTNTDFFSTAESVDVAAVRFAQNQHSPESVARAVVRASRRRRRETTLTLESRLISGIRRVSHRLADRIMYHVAKRAMPAREVSEPRP